MCWKQLHTLSSRSKFQQLYSLSDLWLNEVVAIMESMPLVLSYDAIVFEVLYTKTIQVSSMNTVNRDSGHP